jgi:O-antigen/teichoic acid export membrane protein
VSIGKNTVVGMATDAAVFGLGVVVSVALRRGLGAEGSGVYSLLTITNVLLASVFHLSLGIACSTLLARGRYRLGEVNGVAVTMALALGLGCLGLVSLVFPFLQGNVFEGVAFWQLLVALALVPSTMYQIYWNSMMMGTGRVILLNKLNLGVNIFSAVLMVLVVGILKAGIPGFLAVWSSSALGGALVALALALRLDGIKWPPGRQTLREMVGFGIRGHGANIAHQLFLRFDVYTVNAMLNTRAVGLYTLATSLVEKLGVPVNAVYAASMSKIAQLPRDESALLTAKVSRAAVLIMLSLAIPFALVSPWLVPFMYGTEFEEAVLPLLLLLPGVIAFAVMLVVNNYILGQMQRPGLLSVIAWLELVIAVPLYLGMIGWLGIVGASIASTVTYLVAMLGTLYVFSRDSGLPAWKALVPNAADFQDYLRVLRAGLGRLQNLRSPARRPS